MKYTTLIEKAIKFASAYHDGLHRKESLNGKKLPYVSHLFSVALIASEYTTNEETLASALLHDSIEDTAMTIEILKKEFGENIARMVETLSENYLGGVEIQGVGEQKRNYVQKLRSADKETLIIASCDKIHNLMSNLGRHKIESRQIPEDFFKFQRGVLNAVGNGLGLDHPLYFKHKAALEEAEKILR